MDAQLKGLLTAAEFDALNVLRDAIEGYSAPGEDDFDNAAVLNDPAWFSVVQIAKRVQQQLLAVVVDEGEMAALREALSPDLSP